LVDSLKKNPKPILLKSFFQCLKENPLKAIFASLLYLVSFGFINWFKDF
jgi:hypothetical protein